MRGNSESQGHPAWQNAFVALLPKIQHCLSFAFRYLDPDVQEEAVQEGMVNCLIAYERLVRKGRTNVAFPTVLARYAVKQVRAGRRAGTRGETFDLLARRLQTPRNRRSAVEALGGQTVDENGVISAMVAERQTPVPEQAAFRVDVPRWLASLARRTRRIARDLAYGWKTGELSRKYRLSAARISQIRRELFESWYAFHGLPAPAA